MDERTLKLIELVFLLVTAFGLEVRERAQSRHTWGSYLFDKVESTSRMHRSREDGIIIIALGFLFQNLVIVLIFFVLGLFVLLVAPEQPELDRYLWTTQILTKKTFLLVFVALLSTFDSTLTGFISPGGEMSVQAWWVAQGLPLRFGVGVERLIYGVLALGILAYYAIRGWTHSRSSGSGRT